jgi:FtsH-binding integral membrane protein
MFQNQTNNPYAANAASFADVDARATFVQRTYLHLFAAITAFVLLESILFAVVDVDARIRFVNTMFGSRFTWLIVLVAYMGVSYLATNWANSGASRSAQYAGLSLYVLAEVAIFAPLLFYASLVSSEAIPTAAVITVSTFGGLTAVVFITKSDFSGMGKYLAMASFGLLGLIFCSMFIGGNTLHLAISAFGVMLASGMILYQTSNVMHQYQTSQYVAASLALFASVALLFWYVLQLVLMFTGRD